MDSRGLSGKESCTDCTGNNEIKTADSAVFIFEKISKKYRKSIEKNIEKNIENKLKNELKTY